MKVKIYCYPSGEKGSSSSPYSTDAVYMVNGEPKFVNRSFSAHTHWRKKDIGIAPEGSSNNASHKMSHETYVKKFGEGNYELAWFSSERSLDREIKHCKRTLEEFTEVYNEATEVLKKCRNILGISG